MTGYLICVSSSLYFNYKPQISSSNCYTCSKRSQYFVVISVVIVIVFQYQRYEHISISAYEHVSISAYQHISISAYEHVSISAYQHMRIRTTSLSEKKPQLEQNTISN